MSATAAQPAASSQVHGLKLLATFVVIGVVALAATLVTGGLRRSLTT